METSGTYRSALLKYVLIAFVAAVLAFALGFFPMWRKANRSQEVAAGARTELRASQIQNALATATIDARRGDYEQARVFASQFFTALREETDQGEASAYTAAQRTALTPLFQHRDNIITLLARSDPASADRLSDLHVAYRKALGR